MTSDPPQPPDPALVQRMLRRVGAGAVEFNRTMAEGVVHTPETYRSLWCVREGTSAADVAKRCRELYGSNDLVGLYVDTMLDACNDGFALAGETETGTDAVRKWADDFGANFGGIVRDVMLEYLLADNAVLFWRRAVDGTPPAVRVLDTEHCRLFDAFGVSMLSVTMPPRNLSAPEREMLGERYAEAYTGKTLEISNGARGEFFRVLTRQKAGAGLGIPRMHQIFLDLSIRELLRSGDWSAAWLMRSIIRHVKRGHDIRSGVLAGQDIHFLKKKEAKQIKAGLKENSGGAFDMVTNFDSVVAYSHLDPKYFAKDKYAGVDERLHRWMGPLGRLLLSSQTDADTLKAWETQCRAVRADVARLLERMFASADFLGATKPPREAVKVTWSPTTFLNAKLLLERARLTHASALASSRTTREALGLDHKREGERLKAEHQDPKAVTAVFEQKQGMAAAPGGRPPADLPNPKPTA